MQIMQNMGYFAPWSRQNSWVDRVAIANIRKANSPEVCRCSFLVQLLTTGLTISPQALAAKAKKIQKENEKFARKFSSPHTSQYTVSIFRIFYEFTLCSV